MLNLNFLQRDTFYFCKRPTYDLIRQLNWSFKQLILTRFSDSCCSNFCPVECLLVLLQVFIWVQFTDLSQVKLPQTAKGSLENVLSCIYVQFVFIYETCVMSSSLWLFSIKSQFVPVNICVVLFEFIEVFAVEIFREMGLGFHRLLSCWCPDLIFTMLAGMALVCNTVTHFNFN